MGTWLNTTAPQNVSNKSSFLASGASGSCTGFVQNQSCFYLVLTSSLLTFLELLLVCLELGCYIKLFIGIILQELIMNYTAFAVCMIVCSILLLTTMEVIPKELSFRRNLLDQGSTRRWEKNFHLQLHRTSRLFKSHVVSEALHEALHEIPAI